MFGLGPGILKTESSRLTECLWASLTIGEHYLENRATFRGQYRELTENLRVGKKCKEYFKMKNVIFFIYLSALPGTLGLALTIEEFDSDLDMDSLELVLGPSSDLWRLLPMLSRDL